VSNHCTYHGVSLNVAMDLEPFHRINPCGYAGLATVDLATLGVHVTPEAVAAVLIERLAAHLSPPATAWRPLSASSRSSRNAATAARH
jgi:lipoyl(octanoyl) transferase